MDGTLQYKTQMNNPTFCIKRGSLIDYIRKEMKDWDTLTVHFSDDIEMGIRSSDVREHSKTNLNTDEGKASYFGHQQNFPTFLQDYLILLFKF